MRLEIKRQSINVKRSLKPNENSTSVSTDEDILQLASIYYKELYSSKQIDPNNIQNNSFNTEIPQQLSDTIRKSCVADLSISEFDEDVKKSYTRKIPR